MSGRPSPDGGEAARGGRPAIASILPVTRSQKAGGQRCSRWRAALRVARANSAPPHFEEKSSQLNIHALIILSPHRSPDRHVRAEHGVRLVEGLLSASKTPPQKTPSIFLATGSCLQIKRVRRAHRSLPGAAQGPPRPCTRGAIVRDLPHWRGRAGAEGRPTSRQPLHAPSPVYR